MQSPTNVLYNYIVGKIENHSLELNSIESNSVKIKIPKNDLKTFAYGEMIVLGSEVDSKISNIIEENDNYLILELNLKSGGQSLGNRKSEKAFYLANVCLQLGHSSLLLQ